MRSRHQLPPDFESFFYNTLCCYFEAASAIRLNTSLQVLKFTVVFITLFIGAQIGHFKTFKGALPLLIGAAVIYWLFTSPRFKSKKYKVTTEELRQQALGELVRHINPALQFTVRAPHMDKEFREANLFPGRLEFITERYCIAGRAGERLVGATGIHAGYYQESRDSKGRTRRETVTVFNGMFIAVEFSRQFSGWVTVHRDMYEKKFGWLAKEMQKFGDSSVVHLENQEFEQTFKVKSSDPVTAHYVLSSSTMDRILNLNSHFSDRPFVISFRDSVMYFALPMGSEFQMNGANSDQWLASAKADAEAVSCLMDVLEELEIAQNIWQAGKESA